MDERVPLSEYQALQRENQQLRGENDRLRFIAESKRAETARMLVVAGETPGVAVDKAMHLETALIEQAERERLGLGKQAEMSNVHENAYKAG